MLNKDRFPIKSLTDQPNADKREESLSSLIKIIDKESNFEAFILKVDAIKLIFFFFFFRWRFGQMKPH